MAILTEDEILALRERVAEELRCRPTGCITVWTSPDEEDMAIVRRLKPAEYARFEQAVVKAGNNAEKKLKAQKQVVLDALIYPGRDELTPLLDGYPLLVRSLGDAVFKMSGAAEDDDLKKY